MAPKSDHITEPGNKKAIDSRELPSVDAHDQRVQADNDTATGSSVKPSPSSMSPGVTEAIAKLLEDGVWPHTHEVCAQNLLESTDLEMLTRVTVHRDFPALAV